MAQDKDQKTLNVPPLRFPGFTGDWKKTTLGEIGKTFNGLTGKNSNDFGQGSPYITYKSIFDNSKVDISRVEYVTITDNERIKSAQNVVRLGDIFFTTSSETPTEVGMTSVLLDGIEDCYLNSFCFGYRLSNKEETLPEYFRFYLRASVIRNKLSILAQGSTRFNISKNEVMRMGINLPNSSEQEKIAALLSCIDERITTQNKIIDNLQSLIKGLRELLFKPLLSYFVKLGNIAQITNGSGDVQDAVSDYQNGLYPFFDRSDEMKYFRDYSFDAEAIIYAGEGAEFLPRYYNGKFALHQRCYAITTFSSDFLPRYIYHYLQTQNNYFIRNAVGSTVPSLRIDCFLKIGIPIADKEIQDSIINRLDRLSEKINNEKNILSLYQRQKTFLLQKLFI